MSSEGYGKPNQQESSSVPSAVTKEGPSADDWDLLRAVIKRLYIDQDRTLNDVVRTMAIEYGHKASEVSAEEVDRYMERKKLYHPDFNEGPADKATPIHLQCLSLPSSPCPSAMYTTLTGTSEDAVFSSDIKAVSHPRKRKRSKHDTAVVCNGLSFHQDYRGLKSRARSPNVSIVVALPAVLQKYETLFASIRRYSDQSFQNGTWFENGIERIETTVKRTVDPEDFRKLCIEAVHNFEQFSTARGGALMSMACSLLPKILQEESPNTLHYILEVLLHTRQRGFVGLCATLQDYMRNLARTLFPEENIWRQIWILVSLPDPDHIEVITRSWRCLTDSVGHVAGRFTPASIKYEVDYINQVYSPSRAEDILRKLWAAYSQLCVEMDDTAQYIVDRLNDSLFEQGKCAEAEALMNDALLRAQQAGLLSMTGEAVILQNLARAQHGQHKHDRAEINMRYAIYIYAELHGEEDPVTISCNMHLVRWLREWDRNDEADKLREDIDHIARPHDVDVN